MHGNIGAFEDGGIFYVGEDVEHEGLYVLEDIPEENRAQLIIGRTIRREDAYVQWLDQGCTGHEDLGESGTSDEEEDD